MSRSALATLALGLAAPALSAPAGHEIPHLPGWGPAPLSKTYAGYIPAGSEGSVVMHEHYMFFESEGNPATDPLLVWTNGGPGASSFFGAFVELGPYLLSGASIKTEEYRKTGVPTLFENQYRWTKLGSLLVLNSPPPVGFSYCDPAGPAGDGRSCGSWNDTKTANHNLIFLQNWLKAFPEFAKNDLYILGESYAGVYVPTLVRAILEAGPAGPAAQLKGFAVGDPCVGSDTGGCLPWNGPFFDVEFFHGHGQFSDKTYREIKSVCPEHELFYGPITTPACKTALDKMDHEKGYNFDYNLYDECYDFALTRRWHEQRLWWGPPGASRLPSSQKTSSSSPGTEIEDRHMDGAPCGGTTVLSMWVNQTAVKRALHVADDAFFFNADNGAGFVYNVTEPFLVPFYRHVVKDTNLRVLVYNGDTDPGLNSFVAQNWTAAVGMPEVESWRPWTLDGKIRMGGFVTRYERDFDYLTIRGSGHMVPEYKPQAAFTFLRAWLNQENYPSYHPPHGSAGVSPEAGPYVQEVVV